MSCYTRLAWPLTLTDVAKILSTGYCNYVSKRFLAVAACTPFVMTGRRTKKYEAGNLKTKPGTKKCRLRGWALLCGTLHLQLADKVVHWGVFHLVKWRNVSVSGCKRAETSSSCRWFLACCFWFSVCVCGGVPMGVGGFYMHALLRGCHTLCMLNSQHVGGSFEAVTAWTHQRCAVFPPMRITIHYPPPYTASWTLMADNRIVTTAGQRCRRAFQHRCSLVTDAGFHHPRDGSEVSLGATFSLHLRLVYPAVQITSSGCCNSAGLSVLFNLYSEALAHAQGSFTVRLNAIDSLCGRMPGKKESSWLNWIHLL